MAEGVHGPRQRDNIDPHRAGPLQHPRAGLNGSAGGDHVVDDDDALALDLLSRVDDPKGTGDILPPLRCREANLA